MLNERIGNVTLTDVVNSPFYYVRYRRKGKQVTRSLRTTDLAKARSDAADLSETLTPAVRSNKVDYSFRRFANQVIESDARRALRGEVGPRLVPDQKRILRCYCDENLGSLDIRRINFQNLQDFVDDMTDRDLSSATIKMILVLVSKTFKAAQQTGVIDHAPIMPKVSIKAGVRGWFSLKEYQVLLAECLRHAELKTKVRTHVITKELRWFTSFSVNTFLRPSDMKQLRHRYVEVVKTKETQFLRITTDFSKTVYSPVVSMPNAVATYDRLLKAGKAAGYGKPDDYVFMPQYKNRDFILKSLARQLRVVMRECGLYVSPAGERRTLYSLRHSAIMFRLIKGKDMCLLTLARNCRTSVEMIDRFYAKHLTAEMNIDVLHSMR